MTLQVKDLMQKTLVSFPPGMGLDALEQGLTKEGISGAPVVDQGKVVEDLDLESGLWTYRLVGDGPVGSPPPRTALSIHDREAALNEQREEIEAEETEAEEAPA